MGNISKEAYEKLSCYISKGYNFICECGKACYSIIKEHEKIKKTDINIENLIKTYKLISAAEKKINALSCNVVDFVCCIDNEKSISLDELKMIKKYLSVEIEAIKEIDSMFQKYSYDIYSSNVNDKFELLKLKNSISLFNFLLNGDTLKELENVYNNVCEILKNNKKR